MQNEAIHEEQAGKLKVRIFPDMDVQSPDEDGDDNLFLVGYHRDFTVERDAVVTQGQCRAIFDPEEDGQEDAKEFKKRYHVFGLEAYIHSGVALALSHEGNFPDRRWDVSQLGAVFVSRKEWKSEAAARKAAQGLIETWNDCLSGNVYGYVVEDERGENLDSCWGFIGDYEKSGCLEQARDAAKQYNTPEERAKRRAQYKQADIRQAEELVKPYGLSVRK